MAWQLTPESDPLAWAVVYNDIKYRMGDLVSSTGSETNIFPDGDAQTQIADWIAKALNWYEETVGKTGTDITDTEEINDAKEAIINRVCIRVLQKAMFQRLRDREFTIACEGGIKMFEKEINFIIERQKVVSGLVDSQEVQETWSE
jgi:hypothetical protein